jgi:SNF2 family DNA or RNA helicase
MLAGDEIAPAIALRMPTYKKTDHINDKDTTNNNDTNNTNTNNNNHNKNAFHVTTQVILSGTPLQNEIHELWSLLNFLLPDVFETNDDFEEWFAKPFKTQDDTNDFEVEDEEKEFLIKCLHAVLRPFMTRRLKADLKDIMELPQTREATIWCELTLNPEP